MVIVREKKGDKFKKSRVDFIALQYEFKLSYTSLPIGSFSIGRDGYESSIRR